MWDDVIIGKGDKGSSACKVFTIEGDHGISHNTRSFWINDIYLGAGMTIFKDTNEGMELQRMIDRVADPDEIFGRCRVWFLTYCDKWELQDLISRAVARSFEDGKRAKAREIWDALHC